MQHTIVSKLVSWVVIGFGLTAALGVHASRAYACSPELVCASWVPVGDGTVPANLPAFAFVPSSVRPGADPILWRVTPEGREPAVFEHDATTGLVRLLESMQPGERYLLASSDVGICAQEHEIVIGDQQPLPASLGRLAVIETGVEDESDSTCGHSPAYAYASMQLFTDSAEWSNALWFELRVDGRPFLSRFDDHAPRSYGGSVHAFVSATCDGESGAGHLSPGRHRVQLVGLIPGTETELASNEVEVDLECGSGCSVAGRASSSPTSSGLALVALALALVRRRRR